MGKVRNSDLNSKKDNQISWPVVQHQGRKKDSAKEPRGGSSLISSQINGGQPSTSLIEVIHHIRRQQQIKSVQEARNVKSTERKDTEDTIATFPGLSRSNLHIQEYPTLRIGEAPGGSYGVSPYTSAGIPSTSFYQSRWYAESSKDEISTASTNASDLSMEDVSHIQADAKLKSWGWGGSGMHLSLQKQEMYALIKGMGSTWAWSTILYDLALR